MKINVEMTSDEFKEFLNWKQDKLCYEKEADKIQSNYEFLAQKAVWAVEPDAKKPGKYRIADQDHAGELVDMASEILNNIF